VIGVVGLPPLRGGQFLSTQFDPVPVILIVGALALYLWGRRRATAQYPRHPWSNGKTWAFVGALVVTALSVFTFIGVYQQELFYDHMLQHLMLIMIAAPLFAVASPIDLAWRATSGRGRDRLTRLLRSGPSRFLAHPVVAFVLYAIVIPLTHLTSWFDYTIEHPAVDDLEHLVFLVVGYLFWRQIFGSDPNCHRMNHGAQFLYLFLAIPIDTFTGLALDQANHQLFPAYDAFHRNWGPVPLQDLHIGGVIMWVGGDTLMLWPMIPIALGWMHLEERRGIRADREYDAYGTAPPTVRPLDDLDPGDGRRPLTP
jgi:cytochrome c oxidase assembly factor CtaG